MAQALDVPAKTYGRWERDESRATSTHLRKISREFRLPFEVLLRLRDGFPTLYDVGTHRFQTCTFDRDFVNKKVLQEQLFDGGAEAAVEGLEADSNLGEILETRRRALSPRLLLSRSVIEAGVEALPSLNFLVRDPPGLYSGHLLAFPVQPKQASALATGALREVDLATEDIKHHSGSVPSVHFYSFFATCSTYAYTLIKRLVTTVIQAPKSFGPDCILSTYVTTRDGWEWASKMGLELRFVDDDPSLVRLTETPGRFYASRLAELDWIEQYRHRVLRPR